MIPKSCHPSDTKPTPHSVCKLCFVSFFRIFRLNEFEKRNQRNFLPYNGISNFWKEVKKGGEKEERRKFFDLFSSQAPVCVIGARKFSFNLKYLFHPRRWRLYENVLLLSRVTLHDIADLRRRYMPVIFTQICIFPLIITRNMFWWDSCFRNYYFFPSGSSKKQLQHKSTSAMYVAIERANRF